MAQSICEVKVTTFSASALLQPPAITKTQYGSLKQTLTIGRHKMT